MDHLLSALGIGPSQAKVEAVTEARQPESAAEVQQKCSFLGLVNFCVRFIPDLATVQQNTIQSFMTLHKEGFSVTMV